MNEAYNTWNQDLMYSSEISSSPATNSENSYSPPRPYRYQASDSSINLTPTDKRNPLQVLSLDSNGLLYSPIRHK